MQRLHFNFRHILVLLAIASFLLSSFWVFTPKTFAATGINRAINFQGRLVSNTTGLNVSNGSYTVVFTLYNNPSVGQGTALWTETQSVTTVDGIFRVALGSVNPIPTNFNFNWDGLYLGIQVTAPISNSEMTPRIQMAAVPFAFNAQQVAGLTVQDSAGSVGSTSATLKIGTSATNPITVDLGQNAITFSSGAYNASTSLTINTSSSVATSLTLPTSGTLLTNTATANQTITSTQVSGNVLSIADTSGTGTLAGLSFNLSGSGTTYDLLGTGSTWSITKTGALTVASCSGCGGGPGGGGVNWWNLANGLGVSNGGYITPVNSTADLLIGGQSTASAIFAFTGLSSPTYQTQASFSGNLVLMPNNGYGGNLNLAGNFNIIGTSYGLTSSGALTVGSCTGCGTGGGGPSYWNLANGLGASNGGYITPVNSTADLLIGGQSTASAIFAFTGLSSPTYQTQASFSGQFVVMPNNGWGGGIVAAGNLSLAGTTGITLSGNGSGINFTGTGTSFIQSANNQNLVLNSPGTGLIGLNVAASATLLSEIDMRGGGTISVASVSGATSFASLVVDQSGLGDIFTASAAGLPLFTIQRNGNLITSGMVRIGSANVQPSVYLDVSENINSGARIRIDNTNNGALARASIVFGNDFDSLSNEISLNSSGNTTTDSGIAKSLNIWMNDVAPIAFGTSSTTRAVITATGQFGIGIISPVAQLQVNGQYGSNAALVVNNLNNGDLIAASASGVTEFRIDNSGNASMSGSLTMVGANSIQTTSNTALTLGGNSTGNITLSPNNTSTLTVGPNLLTLTGSENLSGNMGIGVSSSTTDNLLVQPTNFNTAATLYSLYVNPQFGTSVTTAQYGEYVGTSTAAAGGGTTLTNQYGLYIDNPTKGANWTYTNNYGLYIANQTAGGTNYAIYANGGYDYFSGNVGIGEKTPGTLLVIKNQTASGSVVNVEDNQGLARVLLGTDHGSGTISLNNGAGVTMINIDASGGTIPIASIAGATSFATLVVDQSGLGDIFTASASGGPRFTVGQGITTVAENFQVLSASQIPLFTVDQTSLINLVSNPGFETGITGWAGRGSGTISKNTTKTNVYFGVASLAIQFNGVANDGTQLSGFTQTVNNGTYTPKLLRQTWQRHADHFKGRV